MRFYRPELLDPNKYSRGIRRSVGHRAEELRKSFLVHNQYIRPLLLPSLQELLDIDLHDTVIRSLIVNAKTNITVMNLLHCNDLGYFDLQITYKGLSNSSSEFERICIIANDKGSSVYFSELDIENNEYVHRILWLTSVRRHIDGIGYDRLKMETEFKFSGLDILMSPVQPEDIDEGERIIEYICDSMNIDGMQIE